VWPLLEEQNTVMNVIFGFISGTLRQLLKLAFLVLTALFVVSVLVIGITVALLTLLWSLMTGRKPALVTQFTRFRQAAQPFSPGAWNRHAAHAHPAEADVVDVQAREVPAKLGANARTNHAE
jgi:hypothetical protein